MIPYILFYYIYPIHVVIFAYNQLVDFNSMSKHQWLFYA